MKIFRAWAQLWLDDVAARPSQPQVGWQPVTVEPSDVDRLVAHWDGIMSGTTTHLQLLDHMRALVLQYQKRGAPRS